MGRRSLWTKETIEQEVASLISNGKVYSDIRKSHSGMVSRIEKMYGGFSQLCEELNIDVSLVLSKGGYTKYLSNKFTKQELDEEIIGLYKDGVPYLKDIEASEKAWVSVLSKEIYGSFSDALRANGIRPNKNTEDTLEELKPEVIRLFNAGHSGHDIERTLNISSTFVYKTLKENNIHAQDYITTRKNNRASVTAGHKFEEVLGEILREIGVDFSKYNHDTYKPDFVVGDTWVDAKLSRDCRSSKTYKRYKEHCSELIIVYLRGPVKESRTRLGYRKISAYLLLRRIDCDNKRSYYERLLNRIEEYAMYDDKACDM